MPANIPMDSIKIVVNKHLPPNTMVVSPDVFVTLKKQTGTFSEEEERKFWKDIIGEESHGIE